MSTQACRFFKRNISDTPQKHHFSFIFKKKILLKQLSTILVLPFIAYGVNAEEKQEPSKLVGKMISIKGGCFFMGSLEDEAERNNDENRHEVCVKDFQIGEHEVTQAQWVAVMGDNPSEFKGDNLPVENITWQDVQKFIKKLNEKTGENYRLPTEAEWEYAARAGTDTTFYSGNCITTEHANYNGNYDYNNCGAKGEYKQQTTPVGSYPANPWGLYDVIGNVWEWTCSEYTPVYDGKEQTCAGKDSKSRSVRGGSWYYNPGWLRSADRYAATITSRYGDQGLRLAKTP